MSHTHFIYNFGFIEISFISLCSLALSHTSCQVRRSGRSGARGDSRMHCEERALPHSQIQTLAYTYAESAHTSNTNIFYTKKYNFLPILKDFHRLHFDLSPKTTVEIAFNSKHSERLKFFCIFLGFQVHICSTEYSKSFKR